ncbi:MAG: MaoC family dehydratase [Xanthomonadales bacterium]|nr:MaoC family dehydratase [Xanthomonadales bacterium]
MPARIGTEQMRDLIGQESEPSSWFQLTQERVDQFADVTNDHQFIHVDPEKAATTELGGTIAHGYFLLSLLPHLLGEMSSLPAGLAVKINYGSNRVRFLNPVRVGSLVRARQKIVAVSERSSGVWRVETEAVLELKDEARPALVAELITLVFAD